MRYLSLLFVATVLFAGCTSATAPAATGEANPAGSTSAQSGDKSSAALGPGVRLTLDGMAIALDGEATSRFQKAELGGKTYYTCSVEAGKNARNNTRSGYAVVLELQTGPGSGEPKGSLSASDVQTATFSVYKDESSSYMSTAAMPSQPIRDLRLDQAAGRLEGSYTNDISGIAGKFKASVEFDVPFPKRSWAFFRSGVM